MHTVVSSEMLNSLRHFFDHVYQGVNVVAQNDTVVLQNSDGSAFNGYQGFFNTTFAAYVYINSVQAS